jgi:nicotinamidase-related amidase
VTRPDPATAALLVIDVQRAFADAAYWGRRDNPDCERNIAALLATWRAAGGPVVFVRHDSTEPDSPLRPGTPGHAFQEVVTGAPDLLITKSTNSAFYGDPDLHAWLQERAITAVVICGITTNHCCETTARMAGNLGYATTFVIDATHTFDRRAPDGELIPAEVVSRVTAANLDGEFATVLTTAALSGG